MLINTAITLVATSGATFVSYTINNLTNLEALRFLRFFSASWLEVDEQTAIASLMFAQILVIMSLIFVVYRNQKLRQHLKIVNRDLSNVLETMNDAVLTLNIAYDKEGLPLGYTVHYMNSMAEDLLGIKSQQLLNKRLSDAVHLEDELLDALQEVSLHKTTKQFTHYLGHIKKFLQVTIFSPDNDTLGLVLEDINLRYTTQKTLKLEQERFKATLYSVGDGVVSVDEDGNIELMNRMAEKLLGFSQKEVFRQSFDRLVTLYRDKSYHPMQSPVKAVFASLESFDLGKTTYMKQKNKVYLPIEGTFFPIIDTSSHLRGVVWVFRDVSADREHEARIEYLSYHDQLTGLYNRHYYETFLSQIDHEQNLPISVVMCDVNGLKLTNDVFGHSEGDKLLVDVAKLIKETIPSDAIACRSGGDEFIILCPKMTTFDVNALVHRLINEMKSLHREPVKLSLSIGTEVKEKHIHSLKYIIKKAEEKMYKYKLMESQKYQKETVEVFLKSFMPSPTTVAQYQPFFAKVAEVFHLTDHRLSRLEEAFYLREITRQSADYVTGFSRSPEVAYRILNALPNTTEVSEILLSLYERVDGDGYPRGLHKHDIPDLARLLSIIDAYFDPSIIDKKLHFNSLKGTKYDADMITLFTHHFE